jgi:hypothetical protein
MALTENLILQLRFFNEKPPQALEVPGESFLFIEKDVKREPGGDVVARHLNDQWHVGAETFLKIECCSPVERRFSGVGPSAELRGPFGHVVVSDGVLTGDGAPLAMLKADVSWCSLVDHEVWDRFGVGQISHRAGG